MNKKSISSLLELDAIHVHRLNNLCMYVQGPNMCNYKFLRNWSIRARAKTCMHGTSG